MTDSNLMTTIMGSIQALRMAIQAKSEILNRGFHKIHNILINLDLNAKHAREKGGDNNARDWAHGWPLNRHI